MELHIERLVTRFREQGFDETTARRHALSEFGVVDRLREEAHDAHGVRALEELCRDVRYGVRMLCKRPGFTAVALLSLAIGIGANTAIFSVVNAVILRDLAYERPEELVDIQLELPDSSLPVMSYPNFEDLRDGTTEVFTGVVASQLAFARINGERGRAPVLGEVVTGNYFSVLGVDAMLGRTIGPEDDLAAGAHPVIMLGHSYWQSSFGGDTEIIGREVPVNGSLYTIVGVAPPDYAGIMRGLTRPAFYAPMMMLGEFAPSTDPLNARDDPSMFAKARLAPGVSLEQAQTSVTTVAETLTTIRPQGWDPTGTFSLVATSDVLLVPQLDGGVRVAAWLLMVVVGLVLLVACVNLAGFLLARALDRRREVAVRLALGAPRGALVRQLLTETTLLGLLGGALGFALALWLLRVVPALDFGLPVTLNPDLAPDSTVLAFTLGITLLVGTGLGLVPALQSTRPAVASTLKRGATAGGQASPLRWSDALVVAQLTMSLVLLVTAGLFLRSLQQRQAVDPGFEQAGVAIMSVVLPSNRFAEEEGRQHTRRLLDRFRALPGVEAAGFINTLPLEVGEQWLDFTVDGHEPGQGQETFHADYAIVDSEFFEAAGIPILEGDSFRDLDRQDGPPEAIVSAALASRFWPDGEAVGQTVRVVGGSPALPGRSADVRIIGVARDIDWESLSEMPRLMIYVPYSQYYSTFISFIARTSADADQAALTLLNATRDIDADIPIIETKTMEQHLSALQRPVQVVASLLSLFSMLVLMLAATGLYGVVSYAVTTRTREVGIRMALGADASAVKRLLMTGGARLVVIGGMIGLALSLLLNGVLSSLLFGIDTLDPLAIVVAVMMLAVTALLASYLPARRASHIDPVAALRTD